MIFLFNLLKWIFGLASAALSVLMITYLGIKNEDWAILTDEGRVVIDRTGGICLIVAWAVIGGLFLLFEYLHKRAKKGGDGKNG